MSEPQDDLFGTAPDLPEGMRYEGEFLTPAEEAELAARIAQLPLAPMQYQQYEARRRVVNYGGRYDFSAQKMERAAPLPDWLEPLRERAAAWAGIEPGQIQQALVAEYTPGTPLGWHRDVPDHEDIVGISLLNEAVLKFRPYPHVVGKKAEVRKVVVAPRSIYLLRGPSRWAWQHSVPAVKVLRYSITLRTPRGR